jgi:hypothetical protein
MRKQKKRIARAGEEAQHDEMGSQLEDEKILTKSDTKRRQNIK